MLSSSFRKHFFVEWSFATCWDHAWYLLKGRLIVRERVLISHPSTSLISDGPPSAASLSASSIGMRLIGSDASTGLQTVWIAIGGP